MSAVTLRYETSDTEQRDTKKVLTCKQSKNKSNQTRFPLLKINLVFLGLTVIN
jgi:hypothetical protein